MEEEPVPETTPSRQTRIVVVRIEGENYIVTPEEVPVYIRWANLCRCDEPDLCEPKIPLGDDGYMVDWCPAAE